MFELPSTSALTGHVAIYCAGAVKNFRAHLLLHTFGFCGEFGYAGCGLHILAWIPDWV